MKKLGVILLLLASTSAFAFGGGGGGGHTRRFYERHTGVDAIGVHIHENGKDPHGVICTPCEDPLGDQCVPRTCGTNEHCDTEQDACICDEGYIPDPQNACVLNQCTDFHPTECIIDCDPVTGNKTYASLCHNEEYYCDADHNCVNPCDETEYDHECQTCTPQGESANVQDITGTCGTGGAYICQTGTCTDPCTIGEHPTDACTPSWHAENGECKPDYEPVGTSCGTNMTCGEHGNCNCDSKYLLNTDNTCTICSNGNIYLSYLSDPCSKVIDTFTGCKSNKDCLDLGNDYYCKLTGSSCGYPIKGVCTEIGTPTTTNIDGLGSIVRSSNTLQWWSAQNWCKAQGMNLIDVSEFECYRSGTTTKIIEDSTIGYCCASEMACSDWSSEWTGGNIPDEKAIKYSSIFIALRKKFGTGTFWTDSRVGYDNCRAFYGTLSEAALYNGSRDSWNRAICK